MNEGFVGFRAWACIGLAFFLGLSGALSFLEEETIISEQSPDPWTMARQQIRYAELRAELPRGSILGYYSDRPPGEGSGTVALYAATYSLAPHLVSQTTSMVPRELVVGTFHEMPDLDQIQRDQGLALVRDYGQGVMLFRLEKE